MGAEAKRTGGPTEPAKTPAGPRQALMRRMNWLLPITLLLLFVLVQFSRATPPVRAEISYSSFYALVDDGYLERVTITGRSVEGWLDEEREVDGRRVREFVTRLPAQEDRELMPLLRDRQVLVTVADDEPSTFVRMLVDFLPWILILGVWLWLSRRAQQALSSGTMLGGILRGRATQAPAPTESSVRFDDVAGLATAKRELTEVIEFLRDPARFQRLGAHVPHGILLVGPPGTGKTLLARAVAGEANVPFFYINGSEFIELFVGVGAARVRELFESAKKVAPSIVFIDELDAVGRARGTGLGGGHDEREQTLNQLLSELDGFSRNDMTVVLAATNRPDVLDAALLRPGRFDRRVVLERPERAARTAILQVHTRGKPLAAGVDLDGIAAATPGFSGADLANLVNEAALLATRRGASDIAAEDFWQAQEKVVLGDRREGRLGKDERRRIAYHEAGHALVAHVGPDTEPVQRVSIIPRGIALGATSQLPREDRHLSTRSELSARLRTLLAGYAAERMVFGEVSTGPQQDLQQATAIAYDMATRFGMSDDLGPIFQERELEHPFLGHRLAVDRSVSEATSREIDLAARHLLRAATEEAKSTLERNRPVLDDLVAALIEHETLEGDRLQQVLNRTRGAPAASRAMTAATAQLRVG